MNPKEFKPSLWQQMVLTDKSRVLLVAGAAGTGKALALDTPVFTVNGKFTQQTTIGRLAPGDYVIGYDGKPVYVLAISNIEYNRPCYKIKFSTHEEIVADENHMWLVFYNKSYYLLNTHQMANLIKTGEQVKIHYPQNFDTRFFYSKQVTDGVRVVSVERTRSVPVRCIEVDSFDGMFLVGKTCVPTHNSRLASEKLVMLARFFPGSQIIALRKTASASDVSVVNMLKLACANIEDYKYDKKGRVFYFENGSQIYVLGALNKQQRESIRSIAEGSIDVIWFEEASQFSLEDFNDINTRLRGRSMILPNGDNFQQIIMTTNPDRYDHWINKEIIQRASEKGETRLIQLPEFDEFAGMRLTLKYIRYISPEFHPEIPYISVYVPPFGANLGLPKSYIRAQLMRPKDTHWRRMVLGEWINNEGLVYDNFDHRIHLIDSFEIPDDWARYIFVDFGFSSPAAVLWGALSPDDTLYIYRQFYHTKYDSDQLVDVVKQYSENENIRKVIADYGDASGINLFKRAGYSVVNSDKDITRGLQLVRQRFDIDPVKQKPSLYIFKDSLIKTDPELVKKGKPTCLQEELTLYQWAPEDRYGRSKEIPMQVNDHACLTGSAIITTREGYKRISDIRVGDYVLTRFGFFPVKAISVSEKKKRTRKLMFRITGGEVRTIYGTPDHPFFSLTRMRFVPLSDLKVREKLLLEYSDYTGLNGENNYDKSAVVVFNKSWNNQAFVYNLYVEGANEYFANGVLVHNCDALRYGVMYLDGRAGRNIYYSSLEDLLPENYESQTF